MSRTIQFGTWPPQGDGVGLTQRAFMRMVSACRVTGATGVITAQQLNKVTSVVRVSAGLYTITVEFVDDSGGVPVVTPDTLASRHACATVVGVGVYRVSIFDAAGAAADADFSFALFA